MKNDASLLGIFERLSSEKSEFAHTKPAEETPADELSLLFGTFGVQNLRATLVDLGSMRCTHAWHITEAGEMLEAASDHEPDRSLPAAMATIVKLSPAGPEQTQTRQLDPLCWAFAWPVEAQHVAVVEARYRIARSAYGDADVALVRQVCAAGVQAALASTEGVAPGDATRLASSSVERAQTDGRRNGAALHARALGVLPTAIAARSPGLSIWPRISPYAVFAVLALGLLLAGILYALLQSATSLRTESALLQAKADATMKQMVGKTLDEGDYGEVQTELASFAALKYFESALVTNARGRVIAAAGPIQGIRMGDPLAAEVVGGARVIELNEKSSRHGQLWLWESSMRDAPGFLGRWTAAKALLIAFGVAAATAVLGLLWQQRRRRSAVVH